MTIEGGNQLRWRKSQCLETAGPGKHRDAGNGCGNQHHVGLPLPAIVRRPARFRERPQCSNQTAVEQALGFARPPPAEDSAAAPAAIVSLCRSTSIATPAARPKAGASARSSRRLRVTIPRSSAASAIRSSLLFAKYPYSAAGAKPASLATALRDKFAAPSRAATWRAAESIAARVNSRARARRSARETSSGLDDTIAPA